MMEVSKARHQVLKSTKLPFVKNEGRLKSKLQPQPDPFSHESYAFYVPPFTTQQTLDTPSPIPATTHTATTTPVTAATSTSHQIIQKRSPIQKRQKRFNPKWTSDMDNLIRKLLVKHGWGCWTLITQATKFPPEYNPKMISNRVKAIGLTRENYLLPTPTTTTPATPAFPLHSTPTIAAAAAAATFASAAVVNNNATPNKKRAIVPTLVTTSTVPQQQHPANVPPLSSITKAPLPSTILPITSLERKNNNPG